MSKNTDNQIFFNFSYLALKLLGKGLYSNPWSAIVELVANGLDADANNVYVFIDKTDKSHSTIEIFDDGCGMGYLDLVEKYAFLGKNKRDEIFDTTKKGKVMGRKGVGKLAGMYLSDRYYLISKTGSEEGSWCLDMRQHSDYDNPCLERVSDAKIICADKWNAIVTGTMIKLVDVDLRGVGDKTIEGMKKTFADYFVLGCLSTKIHVAVRESSYQKIDFNTVSKQINFGSMTAIWDNSDDVAAHKIPATVKMPAPFSFIAEKDRNTTVLSPEKYIISGEAAFKNEKGEYIYLDIEKKEIKKFPYHLIGWIGIHKSSEKEKAHNSCALRLYIRNKLAVANVFEAFPITHDALRVNIEGEISFDILDDDELGDIANTSRDKLKIEDERVVLLQKLLTPIVNKLISERVALGTAVNRETAAEYERLRKEEEELKAAAEKLAADEAAARQAAEQKAADAVEELDVRKRQVYFLNKSVTTDKRTMMFHHEVVKNGMDKINGLIGSLLTKHPELKKYSEIEKILLRSNKIINSIMLFNVTNYDYEHNRTTSFIGEFIAQYFSVVSEPRIKTEVRIRSDAEISFPPQDLTMLLYNVVNNSIKAHASTLVVELYKVEDIFAIDFIDDGDGIKPNIDLDTLFELGASYTYGTGVGLAQVKDFAQNHMYGTAKIERNSGKGVTLKLRLKNESSI